MPATPPFTQARIEQVSATAATDIEAGGGRMENGMLRIAGRLLSPDAALSVTLAIGAKKETINVQLRADSPQHPLAASTWAALRLRTLEADPELHRSDIGRIGRRFGIPTRETSLIVLETIDDYVRYEIKPPQDYLDTWRKLRETRSGERSAARVKHLDQVVRSFESRTAWWDTTFTRAPAKPAPQHSGESASPSMVVQAPMPAPPAAPAPRRVDMTGSAVSRNQFAAAPMASASEEKASDRPAAIGMGLKKWVSNAPYIQRLRGVDAATIYAVYLDQKPDYANSSAFYLDAADIMLDKGQRDRALRVLSNRAEMLAEINAIVAASPKPLGVRRIDPRLRANLPLGLRVVLTWDADNSDMDLWVTDPYGEKSSYAHRLSSQGARMSNDFTGGYGPEEFSVRRATPGKYRIEANYYGNRQQVATGATTLQVKLFTGFGTPRQKEQAVTLRLKDRSETVFLGEFDVRP